MIINQNFSINPTIRNAGLMILVMIVFCLYKFKTFVKLTPSAKLEIYWVQNITDNGAAIVVYLAADRGFEVNERGVCYGTSPLPTITGQRVICGTGCQNYTAKLQGLQFKRKYYARAYTKNAYQITYSKVTNFITKN